MARSPESDLLGGRLDLGEAGHGGGVRGEVVCWAVGRETILDLGIKVQSLQLACGHCL